MSEIKFVHDPTMPKDEARLENPDGKSVTIKNLGVGPSEETCETCRYFRQAPTERGPGSWGRCWRYPPTTRFDEDAPRLLVSDWCGEWRGTPRAERDESNAFLEKTLGAKMPEHLKYSGLKE